MDEYDVPADVKWKPLGKLMITDGPIKVEFDPEYKKKIDEIKKLIKRLKKMNQMEYEYFCVIDEIEKIIGDTK